MTDPALSPANWPDHPHPFTRLTTRIMLLVWLGVSMAAGGIVAGVAHALKWQPQDALVIYLSYLLCFGGFMAVTWLLLSVWQHQPRHLFGTLPPRYEWLQAFGIVVCALLFSLSSFLLLGAGLVKVAPELMRSLLEQVARTHHAPSDMPLWAAVIQDISTMVVAPIAEEWAFRGVLLHRWIAKWGVTRGLVATSLLFGFLHPNPIGLTVLGLVLGMVYLQQRTLWLPILMHCWNNLIATAISKMDATPETISVDQQMQSLSDAWPVGLVMALIFGWVLWRYLQRHWPRPDTVLPYVRNAELNPVQ